MGPSRQVFKNIRQIACDKPVVSRMRSVPIIKNASSPTTPADIAASLTAGQHVDPSRDTLYTVPSSPSFQPFTPGSMLDCTAFNTATLPRATGHQESPRHNCPFLLARFPTIRPIDTRPTYAKNNGGCGLAYWWESMIIHQRPVL